MFCRDAMNPFYSTAMRSRSVWVQSVGFTHGYHIRWLRHRWIAVAERHRWIAVAERHRWIAVAERHRWDNIMAALE